MGPASVEGSSTLSLPVEFPFLSLCWPYIHGKIVQKNYPTIGLPGEGEKESVHFQMAGMGGQN